jgi:hypothetical protein
MAQDKNNGRPQSDEHPAVVEYHRVLAEAEGEAAELAHKLVRERVQREASEVQQHRDENHERLSELLEWLNSDEERATG